MRVVLRRCGVVGLAAAAAATGTLLGSGSLLAAEQAYDAGPCARAVSRVEMAGPTEPGQRLLVNGRLFNPDGETPAPGLIVYAYQTDARGLYNEQRGGEPSLKGWAKTDAAGRFELVTIRPAPYPTRTEPAHIHLQVWGPGVEPQWHDDILFADDTLVTPAKRTRSEALGRFRFVHTLSMQAATATISHNVRLKPRGDEFEDVIMHGLQACRRSAAVPGVASPVAPH